MTINRQRQYSVNHLEYPFKENWFERNGTAIHYLDEGSGVPILMLHGNPTWSFLYRNVIKDLNGKCRSIAPDYLGFGFSENPFNYSYTPQDHAEWIKDLVDNLQLDQFIIVVHDWGGPIGLSIAVEIPDKIAGLVICNTFCWPSIDNAIVHKLLGTSITRSLHINYNIVTRFFLPLMLYNPKAKEPEILKAYCDPFPTPESRIGIYRFAQSLKDSSSWLKSIENNLTRLKNIPCEIVLGKKDIFSARESVILHWQKLFTNSSVDRVKDAGHFIQEDSPESISKAFK